MKQCPNGHSVDDNAKFCPQCGAEIVGAVYCAKCGKELERTAKFCPQCGNPTSEEEEFQPFNNDDEIRNQSPKFGWLSKVIGGIAIFGFIGFLSRECDDKKASSSDETLASNSTEQVEEDVPRTDEVAVANNKPDFLGTYEVTDKVGCTIRITLKEDETATITGVRGEGVTYYCTWDDFRNLKYGIRISFSDNYPYLVYDGGVGPDDGCGICLKDGWLYQNYNKAEANNPDWRLKANKLN